MASNIPPIVPIDPNTGLPITDIGNQGVNPPPPQSTIGTPPTIGPVTGDNLSFGLPPLTPSTLLNDVSQMVPGSDWILKLVGGLSQLPDLISQLIGKGVVQHPLDTLQGVFKFAEQAGHIFEIGQIDFWKWMSKFLVGAPFAEFLELGMGVQVGEFTGAEVDAMTTVDTMLSFAVILPLAVAALNAGGEMLFAGRWPKAIQEALKEIPEEMGLTWPLGMTIEESFKAAQGVILEEAINKQKRPNRIAWQQVRVLLKQHVLDNFTVNSQGNIVAGTGAPSAENGRKVFDEILKAQGFPDEQIEWLDKLSDSQVPVGDIQQLYLREIIDNPTAEDLIKQLGFNDQQAGWLMKLYIDKAETESSTTLRTTARALFTDQLITQQAYEQILRDANFPEMEIASDVRAVNLVHDTGRVQQSVGLIKSRYLHKLSTDTEAISALRSLNYSLDYATQLVQSWDLPPLHPKHGLNQSKLLSYFISGLLSEAQLRDGLAALNVDSATIDFLVKHPSAANGARVLKLGPNMVLQAYVEGAITEAQLPDKFKQVGVQPDDVSLWVDKAVYRKSHTKGTATYTAHLSPAEIISAFKYGIFDENTAHERLQQYGYSPDDATIKLEIENKGVFQSPVPPTFPNLQAALDYLASQGYIWTPPIDPKIQAAESMLAAAGYGFIPPPATLPPPPIIPPGTPPPIAP